MSHHNTARQTAVLSKAVIISGMVAGILLSPAVASPAYIINVTGVLETQKSDCLHCYWDRDAPDIRFAKRLNCAEGGNPDCQVLVALDYASGRAGVADGPKDFARARLWLEHAMAQGEPSAYFWMAQAYQDKPTIDLGVEPSYEKHIEWREKAAAAGHRPSLSWLVEAYTQGRFILARLHTDKCVRPPVCPSVSLT